MTTRFEAALSGLENFVGAGSQGVALGWLVLPRWGLDLNHPTRIWPFMSMGEEVCECSGSILLHGIEADGTCFALIQNPWFDTRL